MSAPIVNPVSASRCDDDSALVQRILCNDQAAFQTLMRRYNARLYRVARSILKSDADVEDVLQDAYLAAYSAMARFQGAARLSTWLTRIVVNQALGRLRASKRDAVVVGFAPDTTDPPTAQEPSVNQRLQDSPEQLALQSQLRELLEHKIDALPLIFRTVFMLREVEDLSVEETAECLSIPAATVRSRLHRARAQLREALALEVDSATEGVFPFGGARCDRIVFGVLARLLGESGLAQQHPP